MIETTKISSKGQVTIPVEIRKILNLTEGSHVGFVNDENGRVYIVNVEHVELRNIQEKIDE